MASTPQPISTVAVLGTGILGTPIAINLAKAGFSVGAWNRTYAKAEPLSDHGITVEKAAKDAVRGADAILTILTHAEAVTETMKAAAPGLSPGAVWLQVSTVGIDASEGFDDFAKEHDLVWFDAPVLGTKEPAEQAKLVHIPAGPLEHRERIQPVLDAYGHKTVWLGADPASGEGSKLKMALNLFVLELNHAVAESFSLAQGLGLDPQLILDVLTGGAVDSGYLQVKGKKILSKEMAPSVTAANAHKDATLIAAAGRSAGLTLELAEASAARFARTVKSGHGELDMIASFLAD